MGLRLRKNSNRRLEDSDAKIGPSTTSPLSTLARQPPPTIATGWPAQHRTMRESKERRNAVMPTGTVKFFNNEKGYGFISRPDGEDVFVHYSNIEGDGYRSLEEGMAVEFEVGEGRKGEEAKAVRAI